jgi:ABC-type glycerol-3-phosphate transport system substrate-binding protein
VWILVHAGQYIQLPRKVKEDEMKKLSRREFLRMAAMGSAGLAAAGCMAPAPAVVEKVVTKEVEKIVKETVVVEAPAAPSLAGTKLLWWVDADLAVPAAKQFLQAANLAWAQANGVEYSQVETAGGMGGAEQLTAWQAAGDGPDILFPSDFSFVAHAANFVDLSELAGELGQKLGGWFDAPMKVATSVEGTWKGIPAWVFGQYWTYREDLFQEMGYEGFPSAWEGLREAGKKAKEELQAPVGFGLGPCGSDSHVNVYSLLWSFGGKFFNEDGSIGIDTPEAVAALEWFKGFWDDACVPDGIAWDCGGNNQAYNSRQICCTNNANSIYVGAKANDPELAAVTNIAPALEGPAGTFHYQSQILTAIPEYAKFKDTALAYLRDGFYDINVQIGLTKAGEGYNLPPFKALQGIEAAWPEDPKMQTSRYLVEATAVAGYAGPLTPVVGQMMSEMIFLDMFAFVASGEKSPEEAIAWVVGEMQRIMG